MAERLRRSRLTKPGYTRRRCGRGFHYLDPDGGTIRDRETLDRIRGLVIPPAWTDVWICPNPRGHIQATGTDAAGRKQYRYHPDWRTARDEEKFDRVREIAGRLPRMRDRLCDDLTTGRGLTRDRVLAAIVRLLDLGMFRLGGDQYANREEDPSFGLSTLRPEHVCSRNGELLLEFPGKAGVEHSRVVEDGEVAAVLTALKRRRRGADRLFAYWNGFRRCWQEIHADTINDYLREISGTRMTAKDFRTWHGTVTAAAELADAGPQPTPTKRRKVVAKAMRTVADRLGNTPAVARASYVDPRLLQRYENGQAPRRGDEREVRQLLKE
ncbi:DNA topoisomerase IB [Actinoplanes teichomyceticus]|uniref:DNA topoisomerase n=1 Tax=Actinoplanes teichomyceticus TaxID=1867 RepID=A0A561VC69_ACTTI|nr:DNA topoisomerase IB [Actinoplanes teichomyceticus]TWG09209.1 DNA topoisomerase IB [Actinoplanes teichomyceticus]GIF16993.1 DNA topoisomerase [Actinoplanes teichomyceticus]